MQVDRPPQLVLAWALLREIENLQLIDAQTRRVLIDRFSAILRPVCKAAQEGFEKGFDAGSEWGKKQPR